MKWTKHTSEEWAALQEVDYSWRRRNSSGYDSATKGLQGVRTALGSLSWSSRQEKINRILRKFYWPSLCRDGCKSCQTTQSGNQSYPCLWLETGESFTSKLYQLLHIEALRTKHMYHPQTHGLYSVAVQPDIGGDVKGRIGTKSFHTSSLPTERYPGFSITMIFLHSSSWCWMGCATSSACLHEKLSFFSPGYTISIK